MATHRLIVTSGIQFALVRDRGGGYSRINPGPSHTPRGWRVTVPAHGAWERPAAPCEVWAVPFTTATPLADGALGGNLFSWSWGQLGEGPPPPITVDVDGGFSAKASFTFDERQSGLWLLTCYRDTAGAANVPIHVVQTGVTNG